MGRLADLALLLAALLVSASTPGAEPPSADAMLDQVGTWDGKTAAAELEGPYADPLQQEIPFGRRSYYLAPWRAYMDTWPAAVFLRCLGANFNIHDPKEFDATAQVLAEAGIRSARVEVGWGSFRYDDPTQLGDPKKLALKLQALKRHGIRPLMLLNANSGWPCPIKGFHVRLTRDAPEGAREFLIDPTDGVLPGHTGIRGGEYQIACPLVTKVDRDTGRCQLSKPLRKALEAGDLELFTLKYAPFAGAVFDDGSPNPAAKETFDGWRVYVDSLCKFVKGTLGTEGTPTPASTSRSGTSTPSAASSSKTATTTTRPASSRSPSPTPAMAAPPRATRPSSR